MEKLKITKIILLGILLCFSWGCSDDDNNDNSNAPQLTNPLPDISIPQIAGNTITIIGTGFKNDCEVLLTEIAQTKWSTKVFIPIITNKSSTNISFIVPEGAEGTFSVTIKQDGKEYPIGKITLKSNLIGIWQWIKSTSSETIEEHVNQYFVIQPGGSGYYSDNGEKNEIAWDIDNNKLTIIFINQEKLEVTIEKITATTLKIKYQEAGKTWQEDLSKVDEIGGGSDEPEPPQHHEVTTLDASNISLTEATCSGQYSSTAESITYGICYSSTNEDPKTDTDGVVIASNADGEGKFNVKLDKLTENATYFYRAYLTVEDKTYYGNVESFKTVSVKTLGYKDDNETTSFIGQYLNGNKDLSEYGICYSMDNKMPTVTDTKIIASNVNEEGIFFITVDNLKSGKKYYYRAFIIVNGNIYYGETQEREKDPLIGKWKMILQEDTYSSDGISSNIYKCTHPGTMEFKTDGTGMQTGIHYGDLGDGDSDADWHPEIIINFHWIKENDVIHITIDNSNIPDDAHLFNKITATITSLNDTELIFTYPIGGEATASRMAKYKRVSQ